MYYWCFKTPMKIHGFEVNIVLSEVVLLLYFIEGKCAFTV